ncbi:major facilitator superfamily domain-containing protein [Mycena alexandri]|uniref:Major facilitator superfamily domain-containing protein n=1 Tax=Mycena alexandri TaxID=1745969 RepID=A0AAD6SU28_9AGAR|nr:major facilitator superfamily domain-containing protein [Mycena alexandri]
MPSSPSLSEDLPTPPPAPNEILQSPSATHHSEDQTGDGNGRTWKGPAPWCLMSLTSFNQIIWALTSMARLQLYSQLIYPQVHVTGGLWNVMIHIQDTQPFFELYLAEKNAHLIDYSRDPVQALINLATVLSLITGILTLLTLAWWGSFSDRHGRKKMLGIASIAQFLSSLIVLLVANCVQIFPGAYWFLIVDAIVLGAVGGTASEFVTVLTYLSDVATAEKRSRTFSVVLGLLVAGSSIGLKLGDFVLRKTSSLLSLFYLAAALRIIHAYLVWFILPESLTPEQMHRTSVAHQEIHPSTTDEPRLWLWFKRFFFFLKPLSMLFPKKVSAEYFPVRRDWSLTILVAASATMFFVASPLTVLRWLYVLTKFRWGAQKLSHYIDVVNVAHVISLVLIFPLAFKFAQKRWTRSNLSRAQSSEREPLLSTTPDVSTTSMFDLGLARLSVLVMIATYLILPLAPTGTIFTLFSVLQTLGAGFNPAINSLAFELYTRGIERNGLVESGKFFAVLSLASIVVPSGILGQLMYSFIYSANPGAIFFVGFGNSIIVLVLLAFISVKPAPRRVSVA